MRIALSFLVGLILSFKVNAQQVSITIDCSEAELVLSILEKQNRHEVISGADWSALFSTTPYLKLQEREASFKKPVNNDDFKKFVLSDGLALKANELGQTLREWQNADLEGIGNTIIPYLPKQAVIKTKVFIIIKPSANSFVWGNKNENNIFLFLNPSLSKSQFINKVAHEAHHIGMESMNKELEKALSKLSPNQKRAVEWLGGFSEGEAMLAASGSYKIHPHEADDIAMRNQWDKDMGMFNQDLDSLQKFYKKILDGHLSSEDEIETAAEIFYGAQGPFYTVGYKMASLVEKYFGRKKLTDCYSDPRKLLYEYNKAAEKENAKGESLHLWSKELINNLNSE